MRMKKLYFLQKGVEMSRRKKIEKIHETIMCANEQIDILSKFIKNRTCNDIENYVCASIIGEKSRKIFYANKKLSEMFKI